MTQNKIEIIDFPESVPVKIYSKKELAELYKCGKNYIPNLIARFITEFEKLGYCKKQKKLNYKQVELLRSLVGPW